MGKERPECRHKDLGPVETRLEEKDTQLFVKLNHSSLRRMAIPIPSFDGLNDQVEDFCRVILCHSVNLV